MKIEKIVLLVVAVFIVFYLVWCMMGTYDRESFTTNQQVPSASDNAIATKMPLPTPETHITHTQGVDPDECPHKIVHPHGSSKNYESLIYDNTTGTIMTGSQFMDNTGVVAPLWIPPAWDPDAYGPSSTGELNPSDYEDDPRLLYNKVSLECCSPQYPTPHMGTTDPFTCDKDGNRKYLSSNLVGTNNTGGVGCVCMTPKQAVGMTTGFRNYYTNKELGY